MTKPDHKQALYEKLKTLSLEELKGYESSAISSSRFIDMLAISSIFGSLILSSTALMILAGLVVYVLGNVSVGLKDTLNVIREQIAKLEKT